MTQPQNHWMKLSNPPFGSTDIISHIFIVNNELLILTNRNRQLFEIWIYNICSDNYTTIMHENNVNKIIKHYTASLNENKSFLYLFGSSGRIIKLNLKKK
eukprot:269754_1